MESLTAQTLKEIEIILVDDGSTDQSPGMCDEAAAHDERIRVIHKVNQGVGLARNSGLEKAKGEYVYFVDADDRLDHRAAEILFGEAKRENLDICFGGITSVWGTKQVQRTTVPAYVGRVLVQPEITENILRGMLGAATSENGSRQQRDQELRMSAWQGIYRREWLVEQQLKFPSEREFISEDAIFHIDALPKACRMKYLDQCFYFHREDNQDSLTHKYNPERFFKAGVLYREEKRRIAMLASNHGMLERIQRTYLGNVRMSLKQLVAKSETEGKKFALHEIKKMTEDPVLIEVLSSYPYWKNPKKQALMSFCLKYKLKEAVYQLTKMALKRQ